MPVAVSASVSIYVPIAVPIAVSFGQPSVLSLPSLQLLALFDLSLEYQ
jgi:hypothetical protein